MPLIPGGWLAAIVFAVAAAVVWRLVEQLIHPIAGRALGRDVLVTTFVQLYITGLASAAVVLLSQPDGQWWTLSFVILVVSSDVFAYATGLRFGGTRWRRASARRRRGRASRGPRSRRS